LKNKNKKEGEKKGNIYAQDHSILTLPSAKSAIFPKAAELRSRSPLTQGGQALQKIQD
jgi:hypothetical protein